MTSVTIGVDSAGERKKQMEAVWILSTGTFLEYFDLMLYVHMITLLNELFFPTTDPSTGSLIAALGFCSTYFLRPIGALIFGHIGDNDGRKYTVVITMLLMGLSCLMMILVPTYSKIGIAASITVTICRMLQGMSSMGEIVGAQLYLTEYIPAPKSYYYVGLISFFTALGGTAALAVGVIVTNVYVADNEFAWRGAFLFGLMVASTGFVARTALRETPEYADASIKYKDAAGKLPKDKVNIKTMVYYFMLGSMQPAFFYFMYMHCGQILRNKFKFTSGEIIANNFYVSIVCALGYLVISILTKTIHPFKIIRFRLFTCYFLIAAILAMDLYVTSSIYILVLQMCVAIFRVNVFPADPIIFKCIPVMQRFRSAAIVTALSTTAVLAISSFGMAYLCNAFGSIGLGFIFIPAIVGFAIALKYFENLTAETQSGQMV